MVRHVLDARLDVALLGDVLVRGDEAAVRHRLMLDHDGPAIAQLGDPGHRYIVRGDRKHVADVVVVGVQAGGSPVPHDALQSSSGLRQLARQAVQLGVLFVANQQALLAVEHAQALRHVLERGIELQVLDLELKLALPQQLVLTAELGVQLFALGDVLMRADPAAARYRMMDDVHGAPVAQLHQPDAAFLLLDQLQDAFDVALAIGTLDVAGRKALFQHLAQMAAACGHLLREPVHLAIAVIYDQSALVRVEHDEADRHVVDGPQQLLALGLRVRDSIVPRSRRLRPRRKIEPCGGCQARNGKRQQQPCQRAGAAADGPEQPRREHGNEYRAEAGNGPHAGQPHPA